MDRMTLEGFVHWAGLGPHGIDQVCLPGFREEGPMEPEVGV